MIKMPPLQAAVMSCESIMQNEGFCVLLLALKR